MKGKRLPFTFKNGKATFIAYVPGFKGKARKKERHSGITVDEAWKRYARFIERVKGKRSPGAITFGDFIEQHWVDLIADWGDTQIKNSWYLVGKRLLPAFTDMALSDIRDAEVKAFVNGGKRDGLSPTYINNLVRLLRSLFSKAVTLRHITSVPFKTPKPIKEAQLKQELSRAEMGAFLAAFDDYEGFMRLLDGNGNVSELTSKDGTKYTRTTTGLAARSPAAVKAFERYRKTRLFFVFALDCGIRKSDLLSLTTVALNEDEGWVYLVQSKTSEEVYIPMTEAVKDAAKELRKLATGKRLFGWLPEMTLRRHFTIAKKIAGIDRPFRIHDCRHTFASRLASSGTGILMISRAMGHTDTRMAAKRYARPSKEAMREVKMGLESQGPIET